MLPAFRVILFNYCEECRVSGGERRDYGLLTLTGARWLLQAPAPETPTRRTTTRLRPETPRQGTVMFSERISVLDIFQYNGEKEYHDQTITTAGAILDWEAPRSWLRLRLHLGRVTASIIGYQEEHKLSHLHTNIPHTLCSGPLSFTEGFYHRKFSNKFWYKNFQNEILVYKILNILWRENCLGLYFLILSKLICQIPEQSTLLSEAWSGGWDKERRRGEIKTFAKTEENTTDRNALIN